MRKPAQFVRIKKLKGADKIEVAAKHNLRELAAGKGGYNNIDCRRTEQNIILHGPDNAADVASEAKSIMDKAGTLRKDAVLGVEIVISLPQDLIIDTKSFFDDSLDWVGSYFRVPIVSAVVHFDQKNPHCHIIIVPIVNGRMVGSSLVGNKQKLYFMQADFSQKVGERYGLTNQDYGKRPAASISHRACEQILEAIKASPARLNEPALIDALMIAFSHNSEGLLVALDINPIGFDVTQKPQQETNPIGFAKMLTGEKVQTLSCVDLQSQSIGKSPLQRRKLTEGVRKKLLLNEKPALQRRPFARKCKLTLSEMKKAGWPLI